MYICLCAGVTEKQIQEAIQKGEAKTMGDLQNQLNVAMNCGECYEQVTLILQNTMRSS